LILECFLLLLVSVSFEPYFLVSVSANILDWHSFSLLFFCASLGGCFGLPPWLFCCCFALQFGGLKVLYKCLKWWWILCIKEEATSQAFGSQIVYFGSTLAAPFGHLIASCLAFFCSSFYIFWTPYLVPLWSSLCLWKLLLLESKFDTLSGIGWLHFEYQISAPKFLYSCSL